LGSSDLTHNREIGKAYNLNMSALAGCVQLLGSWKTATLCHHFVIHFFYRKERLKIAIEKLGVMENAEVDKRATV
jgi:hypothetical protein